MTNLYKSNKIVCYYYYHYHYHCYYHYHYRYRYRHCYCYIKSRDPLTMCLPCCHKDCLSSLFRLVSALQWRNITWSVAVTLTHKSSLNCDFENWKYEISPQRLLTTRHHPTFDTVYIYAIEERKHDEIKMKISLYDNNSHV